MKTTYSKQGHSVYFDLYHGCFSLDMADGSVTRRGRHQNMPTDLEDYTLTSSDVLFIHNALTTVISNFKLDRSDAITVAREMIEMEYFK